MGATKGGDEACANRGDGDADDNARASRGEGGAPKDVEGGSGDVPGYVPTLEELRLREVYGDWVHGNPGTHIDGGVTNDSTWQACWRDLAVMPLRRYDPQSGNFGRRFGGMLGAELQGVLDRRWNL